MSIFNRLRVFIDVNNPGVVWVMSFAHGLNEFFSLIIPPLFPFLLPDIGIGYSQASLLVVVFYVVYSVVQLAAGRLVSVYSTRKLLGGGIALMGIGIAVVATASAFSMMLVGMAIAGVGGSTYHPTGMSVISNVESETTHGRSMGIHGAIGILGPVAAPLAMGTLAVSLGWRTALLVGSGVGIISGIFLYIGYPRVTPPTVSIANQQSLLDAVKTQISDQPIRQSFDEAVAFVRSPLILFLIGLFAMVGAEVRAVQTFTPVFASDLVGGDPAFGNTMLAVTMIAAGIASTIAGYGADRVDRRLFLIACFGLTAVTIAGLVFFPLPRIVLPIVFIGLGVVLYSVYPAINAIAAGISTPTKSGDIFAVAQTAAALGGAAGPFFVGVVADLSTLAFGFLSVSAIAVLAGGGVLAMSNETRASIG